MPTVDQDAALCKKIDRFLERGELFFFEPERTSTYGDSVHMLVQAWLTDIYREGPKHQIEYSGDRQMRTRNCGVRFQMQRALAGHPAGL